MSPYRRHMNTTPTKRILRELLNLSLVILGVLSAGMGLKGFLFSSNFIDGGVTGVSMLLAKLTTLPLWVWLPVANLPFLIIAYRTLGRAFALRSLLAIAALSAAIVFIPYPDVTPDLLLTSLFGGFFIGAGIGLAVRGGAVLDGTEIAALLISKHNTFLKVGDVILAFNIVLFLVAMKYLGVEPALYSILTYMAAARTLNFVIYGLEEFNAITIVSSNGNDIREKITTEMGRGVTIFKGTGGHRREDKEILFCVVTNLEINKVKAIAQDVDERAFITIHRLSDVIGGTVVRRR